MGEAVSPWCRRGVHQDSVVANVIAGAAVFEPPLGACLDALRGEKHVHREPLVGQEEDKDNGD